MKPFFPHNIAAADFNESVSLSAPTNLAAEVGQSGGNPAAFLTWDTAVGVTWKIEKSTNSGSSYSQIGTSATNSYTDTTFAADSTAIRYRVKATDGSMTSGPSNVAGACLLTTPGSGTFAFPAGSTNGAIVALGSGSNGVSGSGGGGGALVTTAISTPSGNYDYSIPGVYVSGQYYTTVLSGVTTISSAESAGHSGGFTGGLASASVGDTKHSGGNGGAGGGGLGGGGGGPAGKTGDGQNGADSNGLDPGAGGNPGVGGSLGGKGGDGSATTGSNGASFGAGGGGGPIAGGAGAGGCIALTWRQAA